MKKKSEVPTLFWIILAGFALLTGLTHWLTGVTKKIAEEPYPGQGQVRQEATGTARPGIPVIDPANDPLAPVAGTVATPQTYLKMTPQTASDEQEFEYTAKQTILVQ